MEWRQIEESFRARPAGRAHSAPKLAIGNEPAESRAEFAGIARRDEESGLAVDNHLG